MSIEANNWHGTTYRNGQKVSGHYADRFSPQVSNALIRLGEGSLNIGHIVELEKTIGSLETADLRSTLINLAKCLSRQA